MNTNDFPDTSPDTVFDTVQVQQADLQAAVQDGIISTTQAVCPMKSASTRA